MQPLHNATIALFATAFAHPRGNLMIYFIQDDSTLAIKIGFTDGDPELRLKSLQTGSAGGFHLLATVPGGQADERSLHERFAAARVRGEWFQPSPELLAHILQEQCKRAYQHGYNRCANGNTAAPAKKWRGTDPLTNPMRIYLAGKIGKTITWRDKIAPGIGSAWEAGDGCGESIDWEIPWPVLPKAIFGVYSYTGPFFIGDDHGCFHGPNKHGCREKTWTQGAHGEPDSEADGTRRSLIVERCKTAIHNSDLVFAWVDTPDCFGTLVEVGYAAGIGKIVGVCCPHGFEYDLAMWFAGAIAASGFGYGPTAGHALGTTLRIIYGSKSAAPDGF